MKSKINIPAIATFYFIAVSCRYLTNKTGLLNSLHNDFIANPLTGIGPALGALATFAIFKIKPVMSLKGNYKTLVLPLCIYWLLPILLITIVTYFIKGMLPWAIILNILVYGLLEEIGWRGFLHQQLKALPLTINIFILTTLWFLWHLNFEFTTSNLLFYGILLAGSWGIGKVADATKSLLAVSAFHSINNFFPNLDSYRIIILVTLLIIWIGHLIIRKRIHNKLPIRTE